MKKVFLIFALTAFSFSGFSQKNDKSTKFSVGGELGLPVGDVGLYTSLAIGFSGQLDYNVAENIDLTLNTGFTKLLGKDGVDGWSIIPILGGAKYHFSDKVYGSAQLGISILKDSDASLNGFTFAPGVGYKISDNIDLLLKYTSISIAGGSVNWIGVRAAYSF
jgi:hypothetical protein